MKKRKVLILNLSMLVLALGMAVTVSFDEQTKETTGQDVIAVKTENTTYYETANSVGTALSKYEQKIQTVNEEKRLAKELELKKQQEERLTHEKAKTLQNQEKRIALNRGGSPPISKQVVAKTQPSNKKVQGGSLQEVATAQLGIPYAWGGTSPQEGFDCSGLMQYVFKQARGINLPHSSQAQSTVGSNVDLDNLQYGDLVFFGSSAGSISHVGMYVGNGQMIHAPRAGTTVRYSSIYRSSSKLVKARRI